MPPITLWYLVSVLITDTYFLERLFLIDVSDKAHASGYLFFAADIVV